MAYNYKDFKANIMLIASIQCQHDQCISVSTRCSSEEVYVTSVFVVFFKLCFGNYVLPYITK